MKKHILILIFTISLFISLPSVSYAEEIINENTPESVIENENESEELFIDETTQTFGDTNLTQAFVARLYETLLLRKADEKGLNDWTRLLESGQQTGADIIGGFIFSDEFTKRNYTNEEYITVLYKAMFDRAPDEAGLAGWMNVLNEGFSRTYVCSGFVGSAEFSKLCARYEIKPGHIPVTSIVDTNPDITHFVSYLYQYILSRKPDAQGLEGWVDALYNRRNTAAEVVWGFAFSNEFTSKNLSNEEYVSILYRTILNRTPDDAGLQAWVNVLEDGLSKSNVIHGFVESSEFTALCEKYHITRGSISLTESRDQNRSLTKFVMNAYKNSLQRKATADELNNWTSDLSSGKAVPSTLLRALIFDTAHGNNMTVSDFITLSYKTILQRDPSADDLNTYSQYLETNNRESLFNDLIKSDEYKKVLNNHGLSEYQYQNPAGYYQIKDAISVSGGGYNLSVGYEGLKVAAVKKALGLGNSVGISHVTGAYYSDTVANHVASFQKNHGLPQTGIVDLMTWRTLGYSEEQWYSYSQYVSPVQVTQRSRENCINTMISRAYDYLGDSYIIGASGAPGLGCDCSGLVMQAVYAAGLDLEDINPVSHARPGHEYESRNMWNSSKFLHVDYTNRQRGDLIFYQNANGIVIHVAIYLGNNMIIDSWPNNVAVVPVTSRGSIKGVVRPFI